MNPVVAARAAKLLASLALLACAGTCAWAWQLQVAFRRMGPLAPAPALAGVNRSPPLMARPAALGDLPQRLAAPVSQDAWPVDPFAPPANFPREGVAPTGVPAAAPDPTGPEGPAGLELVTTERKPYRIQLAGYVAGPEGDVALFLTEDSQQAFAVRPDHVFTGLGLRLRSFEIRKTSLEPGIGPSPAEPLAVAVVWDENSGDSVTLDSHSRRYTDELRAVVSRRGEPREIRLLAVGDIIADGGVNYRVERIQLTPAEVAFRKLETGAADARSVVLRPLSTKTTGPVGQSGSPLLSTKRVVSPPTPRP